MITQGQKEERKLIKEKSETLRLTGNILGFLSTMAYGFACNKSNALLIMVLEFLLNHIPDF